MKAIKSDLPVTKLIQNAPSIWYRMRYQSGDVCCPYCGHTHKQYLCSDGRYKCSHCGNKYSSKVGSVFQHSKLSIETIVLGLYFVLMHRTTSSIQLSKLVGISVNSAWLLIKKIQMCINQSQYKLSGEVAIDETYVGGKWKNIHTMKKIAIMRQFDLIDDNTYKWDQTQALQANSMLKMPVIAGNDGNQIYMIATPCSPTSKMVQSIFKKYTDNVDITISDDSHLYNNWCTPLEVNDHHKHTYYTKSGRTSNRIEGTFAHFKNSFRGSYTHCKRKYIQLYLNLFVFSWNNRECNMTDTFDCFSVFLRQSANTIRDIRHYVQPFDNRYLTPEIKMQRQREEAERLLDYGGGLFKSVTINKRTYYQN